MDTPEVPVTFVPAKEGEVLMLGTVKMRIMEDGSHTGEQVPLPVEPPSQERPEALSHEQPNIPPPNPPNQSHPVLLPPHTFSHPP